MKKPACTVSALVFIILGICAFLFGQASANIRDTRLLSQPAISRTHIAFIYADDLWVANIDGTGVRRLTSDEGIESNPAFSPDGKWIAFSGQYDGNTDVYVVPVDGGAPKRLTWHPGPDIVQGFTPDGVSVLFTSPRAVFTGRYSQLFTVPTNGSGPEEALKIPNANKGTYSPDGSRIAYNPLYEAFTQWKHYRGGTASTISIFKLSDNSVEKVPQPQGRCNDVDPMWIGDAIYFRSDRNGEFNIFAYDLKSKAIRQLTQHADFPILDASAGDGRIVYEQAGYIHILDPGKAKSMKAHDRRRRRPGGDPPALCQGIPLRAQRIAFAYGRPGCFRIPRRDCDGARREGGCQKHHFHTRRA